MWHPFLRHESSLKMQSKKKLKYHSSSWSINFHLSCKVQMHLKHFLRLKTQDFLFLFLWVNSPLGEGCGSRCPMSICHGVNYVKDTFRINIWSGSLFSKFTLVFFPNSICLHQSPNANRTDGHSILSLSLIGH